MYSFSRITTPKVRVGVALLVSFITVLVAYYGSTRTTSANMFAEMSHSISDAFGITFLFISLLATNKLWGWIRKASVLTLFVAGGIALWKAYDTTGYLVSQESAKILDHHTLLYTSVTIVVLVVMQLQLLGPMHTMFHEHTNADHHHAHDAAKTELIADLGQALFGVALALSALYVLQDSPWWLRLCDILFTFLAGMWMVKRGLAMIFAK